MNKQPIVYGFALKISIKNTKITFAVLLLFILQGIVGNVYAQEKKISISRICIILWRELWIM